MQAALADDAGSLALSIERVWDNPAVAFDAGCIAAAALGHPAREIVSGAGHDSGYVARVAPTAMIFVPCAGGPDPFVRFDVSDQAIVSIRT